MGLLIWFTLIIAVVIYFIIPDINFDLVTRVRREPLFSRAKKSSRGEEECRNSLEEFFGVPFPNIRPDFLKNPETGRNLELDCFNARLKLAVEYNGQQHYGYNEHFHGGDTNKFVSQADRDDFKEERCKDLDICFISVSYNVPVKYIKHYLLRKLYKKGFGQYMVGKYRKDDIV